MTDLLPDRQKDKLRSFKTCHGIYLYIKARGQQYCGESARHLGVVIYLHTLAGRSFAISFSLRGPIEIIGLRLVGLVSLFLYNRGK